MCICLCSIAKCMYVNIMENRNVIQIDNKYLNCIVQLDLYLCIQ